ncbi:MAG: 3-hydroxyacyl-[acyl-carrier-protein] dehydratase FabA [Ignavibacteria bacterium GWF2_33_9]|nr:MAG: 3-hydroxyacyl-[acyl-carrier-protein] dehydratase FabA [Ignavibacteria bacterium GWF2_33_9]
MTTPQTISTYNYQDIIRISNGEYFGPDAGKLPLPGMLMFDRITSVTEDGGKYGKGQLIAELDINPDLWFFKCHFKDDPVMPGSLGFDGMLQLTGFFLNHMGFKGKGRALGCETIKFFGEVLPVNKVVTYVIDIKRILNLKMTMVISDGYLSVDDKKIYTCEGMKVALIT